MDPKKLEELKNTLTPEQYNICFLKGTEPPGSGKYEHTREPGMYHCVVCDSPLFSSTTKYDSHSGWPAFWDLSDPKAITKQDDNSMGMKRTEVLCSTCGAHLGHVFTDGPADKTGLRYCINSLALDFHPNP